jgi:molybdopterin converting factor small subunit
VPVVVVPPPYRGPTGGRAEIQVEGHTVGACITAAGEQFPGFAEQVLDANGRVHKFVDLFVNGDQIGRSELEKPVEPSDKVEILAAIAGGKGA